MRENLIRSAQIRAIREGRQQATGDRGARVDPLQRLERGLIKSHRVTQLPTTRLEIGAERDQFRPAFPSLRGQHCEGKANGLDGAANHQLRTMRNQKPSN